jgi:hypothetical protein
LQLQTRPTLTDVQKPCVVLFAVYLDAAIIGITLQIKPLVVSAFLHGCTSSVGCGAHLPTVAGLPRQGRASLHAREDATTVHGALAVPDAVHSIEDVSFRMVVKAVGACSLKDA